MINTLKAQVVLEGMAIITTHSKQHMTITKIYLQLSSYSIMMQPISNSSSTQLLNNSNIQLLSNNNTLPKDMASSIMPNINSNNIQIKDIIELFKYEK